MSFNEVEIIGAGSLGLLLADRFKKSVRKVSMYESSRQVGGITKDFYNTYGQHFFHGCHYMIEEIIPKDINIKRELIEFTHRYASITEQNNKWNYKLDFAGPAFFLQDFKTKLNLNESKSIKERLECYPKDVSLYLQGYINKVLSANLSNLNTVSLASLGLNRITIMTNEEELIKAKKENENVDQLFGVNRNLLGMDYEKAYIPKYGYDSFWKIIISDFQNYKNFNIKLQHQINSRNIKYFFAQPQSTIKLWCADPRYLVRQVNNVKLDSLQYPIISYGLTLTSYNGPTLPFYINIFSHSNNLLRLYFYETFGDVKLSIESVAPQISVEKLLQDVYKLLDGTNVQIKIAHSEIAIKRSSRYFPLTNADFKNIYSTFKNLKSTNWIDTGSYFYDRKTRYNMILNQLNQEIIENQKKIN